MRIAGYYDVIYYTLHDDVIRPDFACALITEHILVLNLFEWTHNLHFVKIWFIRMKIKSFRAKFAKTASIKSSTSTRSFVHDRSTSVSEEATASG